MQIDTKSNARTYKKVVIRELHPIQKCIKAGKQNSKSKRLTT